MKTYRLWVVIALVNLFIGGPVFAQNENFCGSFAARERLLLAKPESVLGERALDSFTRIFEASLAVNSHARSAPMVIPVVFHILHQGGTENISDAQVIDAVRILNRDYNLQNPDTSDVIHQFRDIMANMQIEFRLANLDPAGNCTNGIEHIFNDQTNMGNDSSKLVSDWPRDQYLNIWVVKSMSALIASYTFYPGDVSNEPSVDGVILISTYIGSIGTGNAFSARTLTHEVGHYLNLKHCWGDYFGPGQVCGDDSVSDTPITKGWLGCPDSAHAAICNPPIIENYQNYMESSYCSRMFTNGQKARAWAALNSTVSARNNLWTNTNLIATGTDNTSPSPCAPKAAIAVSRRYACINDNVIINDVSYNGNIDTYYWEFPNGTPGISSDTNPVVSFSSAGWQPIIHTVSNNYGSSTIRDTFLLYISDTHVQQAPFTERFENDSVFNSGWAAINYGENNTSFVQINSGAAHSGNGSVMLNNYFSHTDHDIDEIVTPGFDMTPLSTTASPSQMMLSFYYSLASSNPGFPNLTDSIVVQATSNCGVTWTSIYGKGGSNAVNAGYVAGSFAPTTTPSYWKYVKIALASNWHQANVRFKFQVYGAAQGNNFYIDDINIGAEATGIETISEVNDVNLFPNPTDGDATLTLTLAQAGKVSVKVFDVTGKNVLHVFEGSLNEGENQMPISGTSALSAGVYIVSIQAGESVIQRKLVAK